MLLKTFTNGNTIVNHDTTETINKL